MYSPQQLFQFIQYAKNYLDGQDFEYQSSDLLLDPNKEEDITKLIAIALAEHRDGDVPSGFATNKPGDNGKSRGPWQINSSVWGNYLKQFDIFNSYDDIKDALDDPGLNAIAAVLIAQYNEGERIGIDNWTTVGVQDFGIKSNSGPFIETAKQYDVNLIENPEQIQNPNGTIESIQPEPTAEGFERTRGQNILEEKPKTLREMMSAIQMAKEGRLLNNEETYATGKGNRVRLYTGEQVNNQLKNMFAGVEEVKDLSPQQIVDMYAKNINIYLPYNASYRGVDMVGDGQNIVDLLQNKNVNPNDNYYDAATGKVITGKVVNQRVNAVKQYLYQYFLNKKEEEPLEQLNSVYEYIFRTVQPYVKVDVEVKNELGMTTDQAPDTTIRTPGTGFAVNRGQFLEDKNNTRFPKRPGQNVGQGVAPQEAAPTFLNNLEKILRVKPQGKKSKVTEERNAIGDMFRGR